MATRIPPNDGPGIQDRNGSRHRRFCPPVEGSIDGWLVPLLDCGGPAVDLDGLIVPRIGPEDPDLRDRVSEATARAVLDPDGVADQPARGERSRRQPGRNVRLRLEASYLRRIDGLSSVEVADYLGLNDEVEVLNWERGAERSRSADRIIRRGDSDWSRLGGWPWAAFDGPLPSGWRASEVTAHALAAWHARAVDSLAQRLRRSLRYMRGC